jgi:Kef-type K+ transport system membrane component KefB
MSEAAANLSFLILLVGGIIVLTIFIRAGLEKIGLPALVGFMILGILLKLADSRAAFITSESNTIFKFLADMGVIVLLFRVGLESRLSGLLKQLRLAGIIWAGNVLFSGVLGFVTAQAILGLGLVPSLFIGVSLTATSVGVSISVWREEKLISTKPAELLLDIAEMDDISGVVFMALLLSIAPVLNGAAGSSLRGILIPTIGALFLKLVLFGGLCFLFSRYVEGRVTNFFNRLGHSPDPMLMVAGFGFIIAAIAGLLGFSPAMGAFFAGLVFSRDPKAVRLDSSFGILYDFFVPFFFLGIGMNIGIEGLGSALGMGAALFAVAVIGKLLGNGLFSFKKMGGTNAALISISMVPRAEIAMIIMQKGRQLENGAVPGEVFSAMVLVSLATCVLSPIVLRPSLRRRSRTGHRG